MCFFIVVIIYSMVQPTAERAGFEPAKPFRGLHAFQACLFNHSSISPVIRLPLSETTVERAFTAPSIFSVHKSILFA